ncbi:MAG: hypothetical protein IH851_02255 [Armatimonadetes bacterium]|nr:hypothetical protein [Armatimonadota bacterium]
MTAATSPKPKTVPVTLYAPHTTLRPRLLDQGETTIEWYVDRDDPLASVEDLVPELSAFWQGANPVPAAQLRTGVRALAELFTLVEVARLRNYLKQRHGETLVVTQVDVPRSVDAVVHSYPNSYRSMGRDDGIVRLWKESGYDLPFQVGGFTRFRSFGRLAEMAKPAPVGAAPASEPEPDDYDPFREE